MTRLCALAAITRSTAGAAMAPRPARTSVRREMRELKSCDAPLGIINLRCRDRSTIGDASLLEMLQQLRPQRGLRLRAPGAKAFVPFEAELAGDHQRFEARRRTASALYIW